MSEILNDLISYLDSNPLDIPDPITLVGKRMQHKFLDPQNNTFQWYNGTIINYDPVEKKHVVEYDDEPDQHNYDLILDILSGDLVVVIPCLPGVYTIYTRYCANKPEGVARGFINTIPSVNGIHTVVGIE